MIEKKKFVVEGIHCGCCAISIEMILKNQEGVQSISLSFANKEVIIEYDNEKTDLSNIAESIKPLGCSCVPRIKGNNKEGCDCDGEEKVCGGGDALR
jgi:copper chaperone CopZ